MSAPPGRPDERRILFLVGAVQFVNVLDFMMVAPLGDDFARTLGIPLSKIGLVAGSYVAAAAISGVSGAFFLDRFDRRPALLVCMLGLVLGTALGGFATNLTTLLFARVVAGMFGGPATSLALSIVADVVPIERRGKAMGAVMGAFSVASVLGVPAGLELARLGGVSAPFFAVAGLGLVVAVSAVWALPSLRGHLESKAPDVPLRTILARPIVQLAYFLTFVSMMSSFVLIPNISGYLLNNLHFPRAHLGWLYGIGGAVSFVTLRAVGALVDRVGATRTALAGTAMLSIVIFAAFVRHPALLPVPVVFVLFMLAMSTRNVSYNTLMSRVPSPRERARFASIQSAVQHAASGTGAALSTRLLHEQANHRLLGMDRVAWTSIAIGSLAPLMVWIVEKRVAARSQSAMP